MFGADLRKTFEFQRFGPFLAVATRRICISRPVCGILNGLPDGVQPNRQHGGFPKRSKGTDCKSVASCFSGSNPLSPTKIGEYLLILADFYFPMGFVNGINAVSPTVANKKE